MAVPLNVTPPAIAAPNVDSDFAPIPTRRTIALRTFIPWQVCRFVAINLRMLRMIAKSHED